MTLRRRLGVLAAAVSVLLAVGLLLSAPAFAEDPTIQIQSPQATCPTGSDKDVVEGHLILSQEGQDGQVAIEYRIGDSGEFTKAFSDTFTANQTNKDFSFTVPSPESDGVSITLHATAHYDVIDKTAEATVTIPLGTCGDTTPPPPPPPGGGEPQPCSVAEGLTSHSDISVDAASANPSASAQLTVKEGCQVLVFLFSGKVTGDKIEDFDFAPADASPLGPGDHTLTVGLPDCSKFIVDLVGFDPEAEPANAQTLMSEASQAVETMSQEEQPPSGVTVLGEVTGETTNCPTENNNEVAPTTVVTTPAAGSLPFTGSNPLPILIAGLVLVAGGAAALLASRVRSRQAK